MIILFFDGVCGLCNKWVDFVMKFDRQKKFLFSPLQSEFASEKLPPELREELSTLVLYVDGEIFTKSAAILKIASILGGAWRLALVGYLIPRVVRNGFYDYIARHRYGWFGQRDSCRLPTSTERERFRL